MPHEKNKKVTEGNHQYKNNKKLEIEKRGNNKQIFIPTPFYSH